MILRETTNEEPALNADSGAPGQCFDVSMGFLTIFYGILRFYGYFEGVDSNIGYSQEPYKITGLKRYPMLLFIIEKSFFKQ